MKKIKVNTKIKTQIRLSDIPFLLRESVDYLWAITFEKLKPAFTFVCVLIYIAAFLPILQTDARATENIMNIIIPALLASAAFPVLLLLFSYIFSPACLFITWLRVLYDKKKLIYYKAFLDAKEEFLASKGTLTADEAEELLFIMEEKEKFENQYVISEIQD